MIQENELILLILGIGVMVFFAANPPKIRELPGWKTFHGIYDIGCWMGVNHA